MASSRAGVGGGRPGAGCTAAGGVAVPGPCLKGLQTRLLGGLGLAESSGQPWPRAGVALTLCALLGGSSRWTGRYW